MIVPMRKLSLLVFYKDYQHFLEELRDRGVVHIYENRQRSSEDETLQGKLRFVKRIGETIRALENRGVKDEGGKAEVAEEELLSYIEGLYRRQEQIAARLGELEKEVALYEPWGAFSMERINGLAAAGWDLRFFTVPDRRYMPEWEEQYHATVINELRGQKYFVTVTPAGMQEKPDADVFVFPQESEEKLRGSVKQLQDERENLAAHLDEIAVDSIRRLKHYRESVSEVTDFMQVENASQELVEEKVIALEGWLPDNQVADMKAFLQEHEVYYEFSVPTPDEDVPILLKNNRFLNPLRRCLLCPITMNWIQRLFLLLFSCCFLDCVWEMGGMVC